MHRLAATCCLLSTAATIAALEGIDEDYRYTDFRIAIGTAPAPTSYDQEYTQVPPAAPLQLTIDQRMDDHDANTFSVGIVRGNVNPVGSVFGAEATYAFVSQKLDSVEINNVVSHPNAPDLGYTLVGGNALAGIGAYLGQGWYAEGLLVAGLGAASLDAYDPSTGLTDSAHGWYWNIGPRFHLAREWRRWAIGVGLGYLYGRIHASANLPNIPAEQDVEASFSGVTTRLELIYRFR